MAVNVLQNDWVHFSIFSGENLLRFIFPFSFPWLLVLILNSCTWYYLFFFLPTSYYQTMKNQSHPAEKPYLPCTDFNENTCLQRVCTACKSWPTKYYKLLIKSFCNINALPVFFLTFTVYHFLSSSPCPLHDGLAAENWKLTYWKRLKITQAGKLQFA